MAITPWNKGLRSDTDSRIADSEHKRRASRIYISPYSESGNHARQLRYRQRLRERDPLGVCARERAARMSARRWGVYWEPVDYRLILARDGLLCGICLSAVVSDDLSFDHIIPFRHGGEHIAENVQVAHAGCNSQKGAKDRWEHTKELER